MPHHNFHLEGTEALDFFKPDESLEGLAAKLSALRSEAGQLGATGRHPLGKLSPEDEGELRYAVGALDGKVVIDFGKPVHSLGLDAEAAEAFARALLDKASLVRGAA